MSKRCPVYFYALFSSSSTMPMLSPPVQMSFAIPIQIWSSSSPLLFRRIAFAELTAGNLLWCYCLQVTVITAFLQYIVLPESFKNSCLCVGAGNMAVTAFLWLELSCSEWCLEQNLSAFHGCPLSDDILTGQLSFSLFLHGLWDTSAILAVSSTDTMIVAF